LLLLLELLQRRLTSFATDTLSNVYAGLGGVAGLTGVGGMITVRAGALSLRNWCGTASVKASRFGGGSITLLTRSIARRRLDAIVKVGGGFDAKRVSLALPALR